MITQTNHFLLSRPINDIRHHLEAVYKAHPLQKASENTYVLKIYFTGLGPFAINTIDITIKLTSRGRNSTVVHLIATTEGKGLVQRWGCKSVLRHITQQLAN